MPGDTVPRTLPVPKLKQNDGGPHQMVGTAVV